ncbi:hypothetical protein HHI36_003382 [Cryptolaemus montrouzieri]|uniref:MADF domain-containing protein n=1 Tax=Cryptolaemus montrouzieri TaxID=559131 RepID=A0ABD2PDQ3_9CUCU
MWTDNNTLILVDEYRRHSCLWDPADPYFKIMNRKNDAWREVAAALQCSVHETKRKMASVLASFRRERKREGRSTWFAFKHLTFLLDKFNSKKKKSTEGDEDEDFIESEEWWNEHDTLNDEPDLLVTSEYEDKPEIRYISDFKDVSTTSQSNLNNAHDDVDETNYQIQHKFLQPRKRPRMNKTLEDHSDEQERTKMIMPHEKASSYSPEKKSIPELFVAYVAAKLESYSEYKRNVVQHKINEILFQADMGSFDNHIITQESTSVPCGDS